MIEQFSQNLAVFYPPNIGSNVYVLIGQKIALIDTSLEINSKDLLDSLNSLGIKPSEVDLILHTHCHADHIGCSNLFKKASVKMHSVDSERVLLHDERFTCSSLLSQSRYPKINSFLNENEIIEIKPFSLKVIHSPGHTPGSVCFFEPEQKLLFSGDTLFAGGCGRTDLPGGNQKALHKSLEMLKELNFKTLFPGHGTIFKGNQPSNIDSVLKSVMGKYV